MQEALLAASQQWPVEGVPDTRARGSRPSPGAAWSTSTAASARAASARRPSRRRARRRAARARRRRRDPLPARDDTLTLLYLCCHPSLSSGSQVALTLRAVGGLTTAEIARAFLVPEATMAQRISRAKQRIREADVPFGLPHRTSGPSACAACCSCCT